MKHLRCLQRPDQFELDVLGLEAVEEKSALAEQDGDELDLEHVQHPSAQALLGGPS